MTALQEKPRPCAFVMSEANGQRSRGTVTVASGAGPIEPGTVLGKITASGKYIASAAGASDGSQTAVAIALYGCDATAADAPVAAIVRHAEVNAALLIYHADRDQAAEKTAANGALAAVGIIVR